MNIGISALNFSSVSFNKKYSTARQNFNPLHGADYSIVDTIDLTKTRKVGNLADAYKKGEDISQDRDKLIYSRISRAQYDARIFCEENPEFNFDDICQELIAIVIESTDREIQDKINYTNSYTRRRDLYLKGLLSSQIKELEYKDDVVVSDNDHDIFDEVYYKDSLENALDQIRPRYRRIIEEHFGFYESPKSFREIGAKYNICKSTAQIIEQKAIKSLKRQDAHNQHNLRDLLDIKYNK